MIRALFFGLGAFVALWGLTLFVVDGVVLACEPETDEPRPLVQFTEPLPDGRRLLDPPDWMAYTMVGMGGLTMLYALALPRS